MIEHALHLLQHTYGYSHFRGQQQDIIDNALHGNDSLVLMPTGGGKSLCYQIPALVRPGLGIVVSPLIALMQDQVSALRQLGIAGAFLNSTLSAEEKRHLAQDLYQGNVDILYIAPERLVQPHTLQWLQQFPISLIAIDEAHCVAQWGHDFRADYLELHQLSTAFPGVPLMALTATATETTQQEIAQRLALRQPSVFLSSFDRPNIHYSVQPKNDARKQLIKFLAQHKKESGIVYCLSRKKVESTAKWLSEKGVKALPYHAGLPVNLRAHHLERFLKEDAIVMVATIAFGMGIDKPDVRFVCHLDLPKSMEAYYQETGRAGRDGEPAHAWMVYGLNDVVQLKQMVEQSEANEQHKQNERIKLDALLGWCEVTHCRRSALLAYFGETLPKACGNCDTCSTPPPTWDATVAAQKLLSCIYRTGQRFGSTYVIDVLRGKTSERTESLKHHELSTFGIGKDLNENQWRSILRQLMVLGYVSADAERYGALVLQEKARPLLRGMETLSLRQDLEEKLTKAASGTARVSWSDRQLWEALRTERKRLAQEHEVPPYQIFHDAVLMQMMENRPQSKIDMLQISGIGDKKYERYGEAFLGVVRQFAVSP
ncbi:DNA helicase RecQ [Marinibactrum halimedae]|uniref:DNA helicase RecQ n=1 Tax=Marinibactrum halimedae TaxID=1444977 RepID=A0AA37WNF7_9GAMM|nr:DNA helicase RecQ [Marinibactrum halimedae]MCD9460939.1 DNA helicase RecQ [Marinibactrum halimedae]GLS27410.1 ATP-dependent DNA helicase RecQ [Marinibactrum halimedae]